MSKQPIEWHQECLVNMKKGLSNAEIRLQQSQEDVDRKRTDVAQLHRTDHQSR